MRKQIRMLLGSFFFWSWILTIVIILCGVYYLPDMWSWSKREVGVAFILAWVFLLWRTWWGVIPPLREALTIGELGVQEAFVLSFGKKREQAAYLCALIEYRWRMLTYKIENVYLKEEAYRLQEKAAALVPESVKKVFPIPEELCGMSAVVFLEKGKKARELLDFYGLWLKAAEEYLLKK